MTKDKKLDKMNIGLKIEKQDITYDQWMTLTIRMLLLIISKLDLYDEIEPIFKSEGIKYSKVKAKEVNNEIKS